MLFYFLDRIVDYNFSKLTIGLGKKSCNILGFAKSGSDYLRNIFCPKQTDFPYFLWTPVHRQNYPGPFCFCAYKNSARGFAIQSTY